MLRDITIGQYYRADSLLHRLDPRVKLFGTLVYVITLFLHKSPVNYVMSLIFLITVIAISKVPVSYIIKGLRAIAVILIFSVLINMLFIEEGKVVIDIGWIQITDEGLETAFYLGTRLIMLVLGTSLLTFTTTPNQLTDGLEKSLGFLNKIKVPVHVMAMIMSIALRFIPVLTEELDKIMKAQTARGIDFESGGLLKRVRSMVPIVVPLFIAAVRRANDLAMAMESRCYHGGEGRTKLRPLVYGKRDLAAYAVLIIFTIWMIYLSFYSPWR
ncbi:MULTISPECIES: energy-coupling factor transporter transmembrane component T family protein [Anaerostipes]|uniref:Energy-coupling factor transporter transmembrane protein EcfT n=1 Tax=Anaerostipes butyraticus TaxID=645466 RepID=A0A916Q7J2_9FIRM|nr:MULTISPECIES: energy-coupling factor transporter transmembrane component T [Anaerostipes]GFO85767.1 energy-coupling factor transporter transmembrane protein EcfT [Anaerostipes butyraticus]HJC82783.1 energy-coupling factor transporter transmembrane protein EcfT [Candidatus Anaerostipes avicola]